MEEFKKRGRFIVNVFYWAIILIIIYLIFKYFLNLIMPFFIAIIFASILRPFIKFLNEKCRLRNDLAAILSCVLFFLIVGVLLVLTGARIVTSILDIYSKIPRLYAQSIKPGLENAARNIDEFVSRYSLGGEGGASVIDSLMPQLISSLGSAATSFSMNAVSRITGFAASLPSILLSAVICVIATVFMAVDYSRMASFLLRQLPEKAGEIAIRARSAFVKVLFRYGKSYLIIMLITFAEITIGLLIIGVKKAVLIGALIAVFDIFPIVGAGLVLLPWTIVSFLQGAAARGIGLAILYVVVIVVRQIMEPRIIGDRVGLHPLVTLMAMFVGASLFGGIGLFGVPIAAAIVKNLNDAGTIHLFKQAQPDTDGEEPAARSGRRYASGRRRGKKNAPIPEKKRDTPKPDIGQPEGRE